MKSARPRPPRLSRAALPWASGSLAVAAALAGCTVGTPPGFSSGDRWSFPLVGPLEDGVLVVPASVAGRGPYLFAIDPDANVTAVSKAVVEEAQLRLGSGPRRIDETATSLTRVWAEVLDLKIAGLTIDRRDIMVFPVGMYDVDGRRIDGVIGRDVIADSLVFGFDRDQGLATLSTVKAFSPPPDAVPVKYETLSSVSVNGEAPRAEQRYDPDTRRPVQQVSLPVAELGAVTAVPRRLAKAQIGGTSFLAHLDLGEAVSQLFERRWASAGLSAEDQQRKLVDEAASPRMVTKVAIADEVGLGPAKTRRVTFVPYIEQRFTNVEGTLGLDFFRPFSVYANWDASTYFLRSRGEASATVVARLGRWGAALGTCAHPGCVTAELASASGHAMLTVTRDAEAAQKPLEVYLGAVPAGGQPLSPLVVQLPPSANTVTSPLPPEYNGAQLLVLDASPFPRACPGEGDAGCVMMVGSGFVQARRIEPGEPGASDPGAGAVPSVAVVALDKLRRKTGDAQIAPSEEVRQAAGGKPLSVAIVKVCLTADGAVESTKVVKSSGLAAYDNQLSTTVQSTWTFEPAGKPVCTQATFLPR